MKLKRICGIPWPKLWDILKNGDSYEFQQLKVSRNSPNLLFQYKLKDDIEKRLLQRYKEAERVEANFIENGSGHIFREEVLLVFYYAGHGCMENQQYVVLNEDDIE